MLHDLALYAIILPAALAAYALWRLCSKPVRVTLAASALSLATLLLAVDIPDPRGEITEAHRGLHRETQRIEWVEPAQTMHVDLTGFYLDLARRPAGALCSPFSVLCSPSGEAASLSRPGAGASAKPGPSGEASRGAASGPSL